MALDNKYRVHEVAKDFGVSTKEITEILTKYRSAPKNHMQVLDDTDLSVIFEYLTQHNQVSDMEGTLNAQGASRKKPEQSKAETKQQTESKREEPIVQQQPTQSKVKQVHRIDTRGTGDVNLAKYDDHVDKLVDAKAERMESKGSKKQKLTKKSDQRSKAVRQQAPSGGAGEDAPPAASAADGSTEEDSGKGNDSRGDFRR